MMAFVTACYDCFSPCQHTQFCDFSEDYAGTTSIQRKKLRVQMNFVTLLQFHTSFDNFLPFLVNQNFL